MGRSEVRLSQIVTSTDHEAQLLELREVAADSEQGRTLTMMIGRDVAKVISSRVRGIETPRPLTHDLTQSVLASLGGEVFEVEIRDLQDGTYFATLRIRQEQAIHELDARPSDAVALAFGANAPIYVHDRVWAQL
jgi:uncharacterized protein